MIDLSFFAGKKVLITGHTGFKGTWMCRVLCDLGAEVYGYALSAPAESLWNILGMRREVKSVFADIRDYDTLLDAFERFRPEIVIHMAAQPLVRESYEAPRETYDTNVMGTVNVLECIRNTDSVKSFVNVTTDKVYLNEERPEGYKEEERLDGYDPYSNSKSCSELVTWTYVRAFLKEKGVAVSTCRAGNVIGGGDFAKDRIIPDCVKAAVSGEEIVVRNPYSTRPYQHVLEPVCAYLLVAMRQYENPKLSGAYNVGPDLSGNFSTGNLADLFCRKWNLGIDEKRGEHRAFWVNKNLGGPHEAGFLSLDSSKLKETFGWKPVWDMDTAVMKVVEWSQAFARGEDVNLVMKAQIEEYLRK